MKHYLSYSILSKVFLQPPLFFFFHSVPYFIYISILPSPPLTLSIAISPP
ncbi:hypothetical protein HanRHA438_Chr15g0721371 [Helianthus annuus]|nr:hypothetical protein HanIR_Chr15g0771381 [Helianthus annuus]KAJ0846130.1 hypothetical protein HanRHA438_Chr15g0721371 [Helianthus annuus]